MKRSNDLMRVSALVSLLFGLAGCVSSGDQEPDGKLDPVEAAIGKLGVTIPSCGSASGAGMFAYTALLGTVPAGGTLTLSPGGTPLVVSTLGGKITANGFVCYGLVAGVLSPLTVSNVSKILIVGSGSADRVILDFLPGNFGAKILSANGGITVDFAATTGGLDSLMIRGLATAETYKFGESASNVYIEVNGDKNADIKILPGTGGLALTASLGGGADTVLATLSTGTMAEVTSFAGAAVTPTPVTLGTALGAAGVKYGVTAYGGALDDKFTGGLGDDSFFGGDGNDTFSMSSGADGADVYQGDLGNDTVDYGLRTAALNVDLGPERVAVTGTADLATPTLYAVSGTIGSINGGSLWIGIDGLLPVVVTFTALADPAAVVSAINTALTVGSVVTGTASLNGQNHLTIMTATATLGAGAVAIKAQTGGAATLLGLTITKPVGPTVITGTANLTVPPAVLTTNLTLSIDGGADQLVTFNGETTTAAVVGVINAVLMTSGKASLDATNHLVLTTAGTTPSSSVRVKSGTAVGVLGLVATTAPFVLTGTVDVVTVPVTPTLFGTGGSLDGASLTLVVDGGAARVVTFVAPANLAAIVSQLTAGLSASPVATASGSTVVVITTSSTTATSSIEVTAQTANAATLLGFTVVAAPTIADADDGLLGEGDDVRYSTENITSGSGADVLIGNDLKNTIRGGAGDDIISGGGNKAYTLATQGDALLGEDGDDTFFMPVSNPFATLTGGLGANTADFSGRTLAVALSNNGMATDGDATVTAVGGSVGEKVNIAIDIAKMVGGFGADKITGGAGDDILVGGPGADELTGGLGEDTVDYHTSTAALDVSLCFTATQVLCGTPGNDGAMVAAVSEGDQVWQIEHVIGGSGIDTLRVSPAATVNVTMEGKDGNDILTGGDGDDTIWGDDGNDTINGGAGNDSISGGLGVDILNGGADDGDICIFDASDTPLRLNCEL